MTENVVIESPNHGKQIKYVTINSEDRNVLKYPSSSDFDIDLPQDYTDVKSIDVVDWCFPANYSTFSLKNRNLIITFKFESIYDFTGYCFTTALGAEVEILIYEALKSVPNIEFVVSITQGSYSPSELANELTARFNYAVTEHIYKFYSANNTVRAIAGQNCSGGYIYGSLIAANSTCTLGTLGADMIQTKCGIYDEFKIVYHDVSQKLYFGNKSSQFSVIPSSQIVMDANVGNYKTTDGVLHDFTNWSLGSYLGFSRENETSESGIDYKMDHPTDDIFVIRLNKYVPRFFYQSDQADEGYWILPTKPGAEVYLLSPPNKVNIFGKRHLYIGIKGFNTIDMTSPFTPSQYAMNTNEGGSRVNFAITKIPIPLKQMVPNGQWYDKQLYIPKIYDPPIKRIKKLSFTIRYSDGSIPDFEIQGFSLTIGLTMIKYNVKYL